MSRDISSLFQIGQRVRYKVNCDKPFYGTVKGVGRERILVAWDEYQDKTLELHPRCDLEILPEKPTS